MNETPDNALRIAYQRHGRNWRNNAYCYPVVSRRSGGLSIGINVNPDKACNFDCIYCQVDRTTPAEVRKVDLTRLRAELEGLLDAALDQSLFQQPPFDCLRPEDRVIRDVAFSGDGEPTTYPRFGDAVRIAVEARNARKLDDTKIVLLTDACYLTKPSVREALSLLDDDNGEIWAKLDAGAEAYYRLINRPNFPLAHVLENILDAARVRPIVIQSLWMRVSGQLPPEEEVRAFARRLKEIVAAGGRLKLVQVYTIARQTAEACASPLSREELDQVAAMVHDDLDAPIQTFYAPGADGGQKQ